MIKTPRKLEIEGMYLNIIKVIYDKSIAKSYLMGKTETIFPKVINKTRMLTIPTPIQHGPRIASQNNKARRRNIRNTSR
jgi:hypothetical protein